MIAFRVNITRDELRAVSTTMMPYCLDLAELRLSDAIGRIPKQNAWIVKSLIDEVDRYIDKKLLTTAGKFNLSIGAAHAIVWYQLLMEKPIDGADVWLINLRQRLCDILDRQINALPDFPVEDHQMKATL